MRAWEYIDDPDILSAFTTHVMLLMRRVHRIFLRKIIIHPNTAFGRMKQKGINFYWAFLHMQSRFSRLTASYCASVFLKFPTLRGS